jgi:hypothetical protein
MRSGVGFALRTGAQLPWVLVLTHTLIPEVRR